MVCWITVTFSLYFIKICTGFSHNKEVALTQAMLAAKSKSLYLLINCWCSYKLSNASFYEDRPHVYYCKSLIQFHAILVEYFARYGDVPWTTALPLYLCIPLTLLIFDHVKKKEGKNFRGAIWLDIMLQRTLVQSTLNDHSKHHNEQSINVI